MKSVSDTIPSNIKGVSKVSSISEYISAREKKGPCP